MCRRDVGRTLAVAAHKAVARSTSTGSASFGRIFGDLGRIPATVHRAISTNSSQADWERGGGDLHDDTPTAACPSASAPSHGDAHPGTTRGRRKRSLRGSPTLLLCLSALSLASAFVQGSVVKGVSYVRRPKSIAVALDVAIDILHAIPLAQHHDYKEILKRQERFVGAAQKNAEVALSKPRSEQRTRGRLRNGTKRRSAG